MNEEQKGGKECEKEDVCSVYAPGRGPAVQMAPFARSMAEFIRRKWNQIGRRIASTWPACCSRDPPRLLQLTPPSATDSSVHHFDTLHLAGFFSRFFFFLFSIAHFFASKRQQQLTVSSLFITSTPLRVRSVAISASACLSVRSHIS